MRTLRNAKHVMSKMATLNNPFVVYGYKGSEYFCDRKMETEKIISALGSERNITLVAPRRMGKTGLIQHTFKIIQDKNPDIKCFYIDIYATHTLEQLVNLLAETIIGKLDTVSQSALRSIQTFFSSWRPNITIDQNTGLPSVSLDIRPTEERETLRQIFEYMKQSGKRCYIAIDEFQQILNYQEDGVEALLRSYIQFLPNVYFIFAGSQQHIMQQMFLSANRPFFQSSLIIALQSIDKREYLEFANRFFTSQQRSITMETFDYIFHISNGITWYIQSILHNIYEHSKETINTALADYVIDEIVGEQSLTYQNYCTWLTANQYALLKAIATEKTVKTPLSRQFITTHKLTSASSVKTALSALEERQLIYKSVEGYAVSDIFFGLWLKGKK